MADDRDLLQHECVHHISDLAAPASDSDVDPRPRLLTVGDSGLALGATSDISITACVLWEARRPKESRCLSQRDMARFCEIAESQETEKRIAVAEGFFLAMWLSTYRVPERMVETLWLVEPGSYTLPAPETRAMLSTFIRGFRALHRKGAPAEVLESFAQGTPPAFVPGVRRADSLPVAAVFGAAALGQAS